MTRKELPLYTPVYEPSEYEQARIITEKGEIVVRLLGTGAPQTVGNFIELAHSGFYEGCKFHAKKPGSVVVGGCPITRQLGPAQVLAAVRGVLHGIHPGTGNAGHRIIDEWQANPDNYHLDGSLVMAHGTGPDTGSSQFYFSLAEQPEFDDRFTVFGQTVQGLEVIHSLAVGDRIERVTIENMPEDGFAS